MQKRATDLSENNQFIRQAERSAVNIVNMLITANRVVSEH